MKPRFIVLLILASLLVASCSEQVALIQENNCTRYTELSFLNYDSLKSDPVTLIDANIEGDCLKLTLTYGGGCEEHQVDLALILPQCGTPPLPPPTFEIRHDANNDACKALITEKYSFDLSGIREDGKSETDFILVTKDSSGMVSDTTITYSY